MAIQKDTTYRQSFLAPLKTCANCNVKIGHLEDAYVWRERVVCERCADELNKRGKSPHKYTNVQPVKAPKGLFVGMFNAVLFTAILAGIVLFAARFFELTTDDNIGGVGLFVAVGSFIAIVVFNILRVIFRTRK